MNVYIIKCQNTNFYKIGVSDYIEDRLKNLQTANPRELILISGFICKERFKLEKIIHKEYEDKRKIGEWFEINDIPKLEKFIRNQAFILNNAYYTCVYCEFRTIYKTTFELHTKKCKKCTEIDTTEIDTTEIDTTEIDTTEIDTTEIDTTEIDTTEIDIKNGFVCPNCHRIFTRLYNLERHLKKKNKCIKVEKIEEKKEEGVKKFECNYCNKIFKRNWDLKRHLKTCKIKKEKQKQEEIQKEKEEIVLRQKLVKELNIKYNKLLKKTEVKEEEIKQALLELETEKMKLIRKIRDRVSRIEK
jgi:hypothetical protein